MAQHTENGSAAFWCAIVASLSLAIWTGRVSAGVFLFFLIGAADAIRNGTQAPPKEPPRE